MCRPDDFPPYGPVTHSSIPDAVPDGDFPEAAYDPVAFELDAASAARTERWSTPVDPDDLPETPYGRLGRAFGEAAKVARRLRSDQDDCL